MKFVFQLKLSATQKASRVISIFFFNFLVFSAFFCG